MKTKGSVVFRIAAAFLLSAIAGCGSGRIHQESQEEAVASWERFIASAKARIPEVTPVCKSCYEGTAKAMFPGGEQWGDCSASFGKDDLRPSDSPKTKFVGTITVSYRATYGVRFAEHDNKRISSSVDWEVQYNFGLRNGTWFFMDGVAHAGVKASMIDGKTTEDNIKAEFSDLDYDKSHTGMYQRWGAILFGQ